MERPIDYFSEPFASTEAAELNLLLVRQAHTRDRAPLAFD
jgi:hypothetical protein